MTEDQVKAELRELEKAMMGLRVAGGWKYRRFFQATDKQVEQYAAKVPNMLRMLVVRALAGHELADRWGKKFELDIITQEILEKVNAQPPKPAEAVDVSVGEPA
jgi:hypothetical protein